MIKSWLRAVSVKTHAISELFSLVRASLYHEDFHHRRNILPEVILYLGPRFFDNENVYIKMFWCVHGHLYPNTSLRVQSQCWLPCLGSNWGPVVSGRDHIFLAHIKDILPAAILTCPKNKKLIFYSYYCTHTELFFTSYLKKPYFFATIYSGQSSSYPVAWFWSHSVHLDLDLIPPPPNGVVWHTDHSRLTRREERQVWPQRNAFEPEEVQRAPRRVLQRKEGFTLVGAVGAVKGGREGTQLCLEDLCLGVGGTVPRFVSSACEGTFSVKTLKDIYNL